MVVLLEDNFSIQSFTGLNEWPDPQYIQDNELLEALNVLVGPQGELMKRRPLQRFTNLQAVAGVFPAIIPMGELIRTTGFGGSTYTMIHDGSVLVTYYLQDASLTPTLIGGFGGIIIWDTVQFNNKMYCGCELPTGGGVGIHTWTPETGAVHIPGSPSGVRQLVAFKSRVFGFVGSRLWYNDAADPDIWPPDNFLDINPGDGQDITCIIPFGDRLIIFKAGSTYALFFADDPLFWIVHCINFTIGCRGPRAARLAHSLIYFISRDGLFVTDGNIFTRISDPIRSAFIDSRDITFDIFGDHVSVVKDWIIFHIKNFGDYAYRYTNPKSITRLQFAPDFGPGYLWRDIFEQKLFSQPGRYLLSVDDKLYTLVSFGVPGTEAVPVAISSKRYDLARVSRIKRMKYADFFISATAPSQTITFSWYRDANELMPIAIPSVTNLVPAVTGTKVRGAEFQRVVGFRITETSNENFVFYGFNFVGHTHRQQIEGKQ